MTSLLSTTVLLEGITHIEDLPLKEFIRTVESLKEKIVTEKLDGANLWFGLDDTGFFTSREGKSPKKGRFYSVDDYAMVANYNAFRAAHLALEKVEPTIRKYLKINDMVEVEVLFGRQPNTVTYGVEGKNFIVVLRGVNGTSDERVQALSSALNNKQVTVESTIVSSPDGNELELNDEKMVWEFTNVAPIQDKQIQTKEAMNLLGKMKAFIAAPNKLLPDLTNAQVAEISLTSVPKDERGEAKEERERVNAYIMNEFKAPIKELLLNNFVRKIKPFLQDKKLHPSEDIGVEGVVVRDPVTGSQTKIVDKDVFTAINTFNSAVRANIAGLVRTTDQDAAIEMRGGAFGQAKIRIAEMLGARELALSSGAKRFISKFKGSDGPATAMKVAQSLNISSLPAARTKISAILVNTVKEIDGILHSFKQEAGEFKLKLKTGKEIGITPEIMKRTLTAFAETKKDIAEVNANVLKSRTPADLVMALYGKTIQSLFSEGESEVKESLSLMQEINEDAGPVAAGPGGGAAPPPSGTMGPGFSGTTGAPGGSAQNSSQATATSRAPDAMSNVKQGNSAGTNKGSLNNIIKGNKVVQKRARNFVRQNKFPIPKSTPDDKIAPFAEPLGAKKKKDSLPVETFETADGGTTAAGAIAGFQKPLGAAGSKAALSTKVTQPPKKKKFDLISRVQEDWAHVDDMKFATDVDDSAQSRNDVEFNQLRNNVNIGKDVTQMDVNRYLDKAHELNDEVDTVTYGLETDDGSVIKVYVNATQGDEFEKALADLLGQEDDPEEVINMLASKFDIVDVEWPQSMQGSGDQGVNPNATGEEPAAPLGDDENPEINLEIDGVPPETTDGTDISADTGNETPETQPGEDTDTEVTAPPADSENPDANPDETPDGGGEDEGDDTEDEGGEEERDEFGQVIKKSKKKKTEEPTEEAEFVAGNLLVEAETGNQITFPNNGLNMIASMLVALGFDMNLSRPFNYQAKQLIAQNSPGLTALKQSTVVQKLKNAQDQLASVMKLSPGATPAAPTPAGTTVTQGFSLLGQVVAEEEAAESGEWSIAKTVDPGHLTLIVKGMKIKIDHDEADKLSMGLSGMKTVSVKSASGKRYSFTPIFDNGGFAVKEVGDETKFPNGILLPHDSVDYILKALDDK